ncbi:hypothetical protein QR98_0020120 [Sarcoptes scabiei]|uniref:Uncharacterized protein n=1 Tax=Sarcoptes scabiei TaxID=52283 RepID=A0A131ZYI9_SARSC|nr:hypothetical protein QR98_0020120 [Sarcoptes scabiei]
MFEMRFYLSRSPGSGKEIESRRDIASSYLLEHASWPYSETNFSDFLKWLQWKHLGLLNA